MTLSVIGAGFGRTGTLSIKLALERIGFGPCLHMENLFDSPDQLRRWQAVTDEGPVDWGRVLEGFSSTIDWPAAAYWRELHAAYPQARILLSVRPAEAWWRSFSGTIQRLIRKRDSVRDAHVREVLNYAERIITVRTFGGTIDDETAVLAAYQRRIEEVTRIVPAEQLLTFDVRDGWEPLCRFLGVPVPDSEFPRVNKAEEFWQQFGAAAR